MASGPSGIRRAWVSSSRRIGTSLRFRRVSRIPRSSAAARAVSSACSAAPTSATGPLMQMARWKSPRARGMERRSAAAIPPADCPATVTLDGSPPNASMLCCTHSRAANQSRTPRLAPPSSIERKPSIPKAVIDTHQHHAVVGEALPPVPRAGAAAGEEATAVDPHQHRQPRSAGVRREHVEIEAVVPLDRGLRDQSELLLGLQGRGAIGEGVTGPLPVSRGGPAARSAPRRAGAAAYGIPRNATAPFSMEPRTFPCFVSTIGSIPTSTLLSSLCSSVGPAWFAARAAQDPAREPLDLERRHGREPNVARRRSNQNLGGSLLYSPAVRGLVPVAKRLLGEVQAHAGGLPGFQPHLLERFQLLVRSLQTDRDRRTYTWTTSAPRRCLCS